MSTSLLSAAKINSNKRHTARVLYHHLCARARHAYLKHEKTACKALYSRWV